MNTASTQSKCAPLAVVAALGVVFGDIGTSPLYSFKECLSRGFEASDVYGIISLVLWSLIILVSVKYVGIILRADNHGEGGILALLALAFPEHIGSATKRTAITMTMLGLFGAALLYGDGMITPAISVLSAVEGLSLLSPVFEKLVVPLTVVILIVLFSMQKKGTGAVGRVFGVVMLAWFAVIAVMGLVQVVQHPGILWALNPVQGLSYLFHHASSAVVVLGSVFLAVTGGEALYADMGHFGRIPIQVAWNFLVLPALALNYLGQGALVLSNPSASENPFFLLAPGWALLPIVILATAATIIASQALISGAFSLTMQAMQMGYLPRIRVLHTNELESGQIYIPQVSAGLAVACTTLVIIFQSSSSLAAAYGIAVTLTMMTTTALFFFAARRLWGWSLPLVGTVCGTFLLIETGFFASNALKIIHGGWLPLAIGGLVFTCMTTWKKGRELIASQLRETLPFQHFVESIGLSGTLDTKLKPHRVKGTAMFFSSRGDLTPVPLLANLKHNHVLHERNILLNIMNERVPTIPAAERVQIEILPDEFFRMTARFGFMELPTIGEVIDGAAKQGFLIDLEKTTFFLGRETLVPTGGRRGLARWREAIFMLMSQNAQNAAEFFRLPSNRTIEIGRQVEI